MSQVMPKLREEDPQASRLRSKISGCLEEVGKEPKTSRNASKDTENGEKS